MQALLFVNISILAATAIFMTGLFFAYLKAEKKLAKYGESKIFKKK